MASIQARRKRKKVEGRIRRGGERTKKEEEGSKHNEGSREKQDARSKKQGEKKKEESRKQKEDREQKRKTRGSSLSRDFVRFGNSGEMFGSVR